MTLIRRCLMLMILYGVASVSQAQMPSIHWDLEQAAPYNSPEITPEPFPSVNRSDMHIVSDLVNRFKIPRSLALDIVRLANEHAVESFPTKADILAMAEIESGFRPNAKYRDCYGLMMIQKKSHLKKLRRGEDLMNPQTNMRIGTEIMKEYYEAVNHDKRAAILSLNVGVGNYMKKRYNSKYYSKFMRARSNYIN